MVKRSNLNSGFIKTIYDKNLCLSENPKGLDINWPKSFAKLYYSDIAEHIFKRNSSPRILELNSKNHLRKVMWLSFFNDPLLYTYISSHKVYFIAIKTIKVNIPGILLRYLYL